MRITIDSNVLVYSVDSSRALKQNLAIDLIERMARKQHPLIDQCLYEFLNATTRKLGVPLGQAVAIVAGWAATLSVASPGSKTLGLTCRLLQAHKLSVFDARLLAVCEENNVGYLLTEDLQDGGRYEHVTAVNPFISTNDRLVNTLLPP